MASPQLLAKNFAEFYYQTFSTNRAGLKDLYRATSMLTFEGSESLGVDAIIVKLLDLPFQKTSHRIVTLDAQPFPGGLLVMITGQLTVDDNEHPINFSQTFSLIQDGERFFVHNDLFRLNYG